uniref:Lysozyme n=1 Tax=Acrobeloides nanus TaxID=290746 RepID=A0A914CFR1_9BILA
MVKMLAFLTFVLLIHCSNAKIGFDGIASMSPNDFKCLSNNGYSFFVARAWKSYGNYDETGIQNIKNARAAGWTDTDAYIFPCLESSCAPPANQVEATIDQLRAEQAEFGTLWLDIERYAWPADQQHNRDFITGLIQGAKNRNVNVGVYTNYNNWAAIVGGSWTGAQDLPLWWADWNGHQDVTTGFSSFGGWTKVAVHQYSGDLKNPPCVSDMDQNYKP